MTKRSAEKPKIDEDSKTGDESSDQMNTGELVSKLRDRKKEIAELKKSLNELMIYLYVPTVLYNEAFRFRTGIY